MARFLKFLKNSIYLLFLVAAILGFFWKIFFKGLLPMPVDALMGLYHPFRDFFREQYPSGVAFKNFLITDPVRQQYVWRELSVSILKRFELPFWNPYNFTGTPLLGSFQSASFYPLNVVFFILPFETAWFLLVILQPLLAGIFTYWYLREVGLRKASGALGGLVFAFSGFSIAWMEWNTISHVALWLPLTLLAIEKVLRFKRTKNREQRIKVLRWSTVFIFSLTASFLAGHLQVFFYLTLVVLAYTIARIVTVKKLHKIRAFLLFIIGFLLFAVVTLPQSLLTLRLIGLSARAVDVGWKKEGWFIPGRHLVQFLAPDFFGNPATLNYWGVWNYGEMAGYLGVLPLILAFLALFWRRDKKTLFWGILGFLGILLATDNFVARLPFELKLPFFSTAQPTRLLFLVDFSLAVLVALGLDSLIRKRIKLRRLIGVIGAIGLIYLLLWGWALGFWPNFNGFADTIRIEDLVVVKRNLILPTGLFLASAFILWILSLKSKRTILGFNWGILGTWGVLGLTVFDLWRFGWKFTPFSKREYLFPQTETVSFLRDNLGWHRYMTTDKRILPPNTNLPYRLYSVDGYDPLYLKTYGELAAAWERNEPNINPPFGFNRQIQLVNFESRIADLLGIKYVLSLDDLDSKKLVKVFQEGETRVYENKKVFPRVFLVEKVTLSNNKQQTINDLFNGDIDLRKTAVVSDYYGVLDKKSRSGHFVSEAVLAEGERVKIIEYSENLVKLIVFADQKRFLVLTDSFYPTWKAYVDGQETEIYRVDYNFRGIAAPKGEHEVVFSINMRR